MIYNISVFVSALIFAILTSGTPALAGKVKMKDVAAECETGNCVNAVEEAIVALEQEHGNGAAYDSQIGLLAATLLRSAAKQGSSVDAAEYALSIQELANAAKNANQAAVLEEASQSVLAGRPDYFLRARPKDASPGTLPLQAFRNPNFYSIHRQ